MARPSLPAEIFVDGMRDMLRGSLARSLRGMTDEDRLSAAWVVACGRAMAGHGAISGFADGVVHVEVADATWLRQMEIMRTQLRAEISRIAGVEVRGIHFEVKGAAVRSLPRLEPGAAVGRRR